MRISWALRKNIKIPKLAANGLKKSASSGQSRSSHLNNLQKLPVIEVLIVDI